MPLGSSGVTAGSLALPTGICLMALGIVVIVSERTKTISPSGIEWRALFQSTLSIPWDRVETVTADLRVIMEDTILGSLKTQENLVAVCGNGCTIRLNTTRYKDGKKYVSTIPDYARPAAIEWMLSQRDADLGILKLTHDGIGEKRNSVKPADLPQVIGRFLYRGMFAIVWLMVLLFAVGDCFLVLKSFLPLTVAVGISLGLASVVGSCVLWNLARRPKSFFKYEDIDSIRVENGSVVIGYTDEEQMFPADLVRNALFLSETVALIQQTQDRDYS